MDTNDALARLAGVRQTAPNQWEAMCPVHEADGGGHRASLAITTGANGHARFHCHAGCHYRDVIAAIGDTTGPATATKVASAPKRTLKIVESYPYTDADGRLLYEVVRLEPKDFRQRRPDGTGGWVWNMKGVGRVLYHLPDVLAAVNNGVPVFIVEGEKDAAALADLGLTATCNPAGAGKWRDLYNAHLRGADVVIIADKDEPGRRHARQVAEALDGVARRVRVVELPDRAGHTVKDAADWTSAGGTAEELHGLIEAARDDKPVPTDVPVPTSTTIPSEYRPTDAGNARRFADANRHRARHCSKHGRWYAWDGRRWTPDADAIVMAMAKATVRGMIHDAADVVDKEERRALLHWAMQCESRFRLDAMLYLARSEPGIPTEPDVFDRDPMSLNVANGILDLRTGELRPHDPAALLTKLAPVTYDPAATCPGFVRFIERIMPDADCRAYLQRAAGYMATGRTGERAWWILWGPGANGKSCWLDILARILGDYARRVPVELILLRHGDGIPNDLAMLAGARVGFTSESAENRRLNEARIKDLTSGAEPMTARFLHQEYFQFRPVCKLLLSTNNKPVIRETSEALWDRVHLVPFTAIIPKPERIPGLSETLAETEAAGILNWIVAGCLEWQRDGLRPPDAVLAATNEYRQEQDFLANFLAECTVTDPNVRDTARNLYAGFEAWCKTSGEQPMSARAFGMRLKEKGFTKEKTRADVVWTGLQLAVSVDDVDDKGLFSGFSLYKGQQNKNPNNSSTSSTPTSENTLKPNINMDLKEKRPDTLSSTSSTASGLSSTATGDTAGDTELTPEAMAALLAEAERGGVQ